MDSDLSNQVQSDEAAPKRASSEILQSEIREGVDALERSLGSLFISALSAGMDIGFSLLLMAVMLTSAQGRLPKPVVEILVANMYSVGFLLVVLGRSELFTEQTTLAVLPVLSGKASISGLLRLWCVVLVANLIGATFFARLVTWIAPSLGTVQIQAFGEIARRVVDHGMGVIFLSAVLAGWLMGLLSWLVAAGRDTISQIVVVWLITTSIGFAGLHHSIVGTAEVMAGLFANQGITPHDILRFIPAATLGNIVGGAFFVAILKYGHAKPDSPAT